jgi:hypothetical protein
MFGFAVKLPVSKEQQNWVDEGFSRLAAMLGRERMLQAEFVLPNNEFFPDLFDGSKESVVAMAERIADYMGISQEAFFVELYAENEDAWREHVPVWNGRSRDSAGLYFHGPEDSRKLIGVNANQLSDPLSLAATLAHELAHVILLGKGLFDREAPDMEPMTDLCTVYLGLGFISASAAYQFKQWTNNRTQGWSTSRKGYLSEEVWAYSLARFAYERGEQNSPWTKQLPSNIRGYFKRSAAWLEKHGARIE